MTLLVLDTDVASELIRGRPPAALLEPLAATTPAISFATHGELKKWTVARHWGSRRMRSVTEFLTEAAVLPYDRKVAQRWGEMQAYARFRGRPRPVNDTWIAACCIVRGLPLATLNTKDFLDFAEHEGLELVALS